MIIGSNDIKASCRAMLFSAKEAHPGEVPLPVVPDPESWVYPSSWISRPSSASEYQITGVICFKKTRTYRETALSLWAASGSSVMGYVDWGDGSSEPVYVTSTSSNTWGTCYHNFSSGTGHSIVIDGIEHEQWKFRIYIYNSGDYSDSNPVYFAGLYERTTNVSERSSLQWISVGNNVKIHINSDALISSDNWDSYRIFGRERLLEYVEIGSNCSLIGRAFEPVTGIYSNLKEIVFKGTITIPSYAFKECYKLSKVTGAENITSINSGSFNNCPSLTKLICPNATLSAAPTGCTNLKIMSCKQLGSSGLSVCLYK